jgi:hypothetical protein
LVIKKRKYSDREIENTYSLVPPTDEEREKRIRKSWRPDNTDTIYIMNAWSGQHNFDFREFFQSTRRRMRSD